MEESPAVVVRRCAVRGLAALGLWLAACAPVEPPTAVEAPPRLPVSLNEVMVAMVNQAADPIWVAAWRNPETDAEWRSLERRALQLQLAGALLAYPGTGPMDTAWTADPAWQDFAGRLGAAGAHAAAAARARDVTAISAAGDEIVDVCEACHLRFKPAVPTGGKFGELSPTGADFDAETE
jgi:hypothetical protein